MDMIFQSLLILMAAMWIVAIARRLFGVATTTGAVIAGVIMDQAVCSWIEPNK